MTRILVAGVGSIGHRHLRNLVALGLEDLVLYRTGRGTLDVEEAFPVEASLAAALARRPRAVVVSNPTSLHLETALAAVRAGAHLLIEKPVSHSLDGLEELALEVGLRGVSVLMGFQFRFHPTLRQIREWIGERAIGDVVSAHVRWGEHLPGWHPWEDYRKSYSARRDLGGGVVLTLCHPFDYLAWILGPVRRVAAWTGRRSGLGLEVEDLAFATLEHETGALSGVYLDYVRRPPAHRLEVIGTEGTMVWDARSGEARLHRAGKEDWIAVVPPDGFERNTLFMEEMRHFLACLDGTASPACALDDGIRALRVALAVRDAAESGARIDV